MSVLSAAEPGFHGVKLNFYKSVRINSEVFSAKCNGLLNLERLSIVVGKSAIRSGVCVVDGRFRGDLSVTSYCLGCKSQSLVVNLATGEDACIPGAQSEARLVAQGCSQERIEPHKYNVALSLGNLQ